MGKNLKYKLKPLKLGEKTIGERIAHYRKARALTQNELAKKIGITRHLVSDYETGRLHLNDEMVARFSLALNISSDKILGLEKANNFKKLPSLRIIRRMIKIEELSEIRKKAILKTIDDLIKANS